MTHDARIACRLSSSTRSSGPTGATTLLGLVLAGLCGLSTPVYAQQPEAAEAGATAAPAEDPPPTWRWRKADRKIKVVALAGSIGAWPRDPYSKRIENLCKNVEVKNLSKTGYGAYALKKRFKTHVLQHPAARVRGEGEEAWLLFQGGLNSVAMPEQTNHHIHDLIMRAHKRDINVLLLSLTPWGDDLDKRFRAPAHALKLIRDTRAVVEFAAGNPTPAQALGSHAKNRPEGADAPWATHERPDLAVNLYRSALRDYKAPLRDVETLKKQLAGDKEWRRRHRDLDEAARTTALEDDAKEAAEISRWYLRKELRSFDHIHPNNEGHELIATLVCPNLPENWGCSCPPLPPEVKAEAKASQSQVTPDIAAFYPRWVRAMLRVVSGTVDSPKAGH